MGYACEYDANAKIHTSVVRAMDETQTFGKWVGLVEYVQNRVNKGTPIILCADSANTAKMEDANCKQWHEINKNPDWMK